MRRLTAVTLFVAMLAYSGSAAVACGDKLLAIGRGVRFPRLLAAHQATLVIYSPAKAALSARLQTTLRRGVRTLHLVQDATQLDAVLRSQHVDVVLVEYGDLAGITRQLQVASSKPAILPIVVKPSKGEFAAVQKAYTFALKANADDLELLATIDEAMTQKLKSSGKS